MTLSKRTEGCGRKGMTLTETAIVLAIVGIVLGSVWLAASSVNQKNRVQDAAAMVLQIASNVRGVYEGQAGASIPNFSQQVSMGLFPKAVLNEAESQTVNPWAGEYTLAFTSGGLYGFTVALSLPDDMAVSSSREVCADLFTRLRPTGPEQGMTGSTPVSTKPATSMAHGGGQEGVPVAAYLARGSGGYVEVTGDSILDMTARLGTASCKGMAFYFSL